MSSPVLFDHLEAHVEDIRKYCDFLAKVFKGGRYKQITDSGVSMFLSDDGLHIEIKQRVKGLKPCMAGICMPCLRMENAKNYIENELGYSIIKTVNNPDGDVYFFTDYEGITWHIKSYLVLDKFVNI